MSFAPAQRSLFARLPAFVPANPSCTAPVQRQMHSLATPALSCAKTTSGRPRKMMKMAASETMQSKRSFVTPNGPQFAVALPEPNRQQPSISNPIPQPQSSISLPRGSGPEPQYDRIVSGYSVFHSPQPFHLVHGGVLPEFDIAYETWGHLNADRSNAILLHTGLSASSHAKSHDRNRNPGWWEKFIGPGMPLDTNKFFVICTNVIGGCYGSTGPSSMNPATGRRYGSDFPIVTVHDIIRAQLRLLDYLGIEKLHASVGSSMGGMQSLCLAADAPHRVSRLISISACARSHPYSIAVRHTQRQVLMADPNYANGHYYEGTPPHVGMKLAREIATITYRSGPEWEKRFGRKRANPAAPVGLCPDFLVETYLDHQGERFCLTYDANSLLYISKAMDLFDMSHPPPVDPNKGGLALRAASGLPPPATSGFQCEEPSPEVFAASLNEETDPVRDTDRLVQGLKTIRHPVLVLGVQSDILFPVWQQREVAECLRKGGNKNVTYYELDSIFGHDTFLIELQSVGGAVKGHLENRIGFD
ncbi:homoserine acetyltransferase [Gonapodya prolifera JEL478]|uniref:Homoserine acetyltransferase n=1 Tax=Gonapodya prolifera (strain JEL478) TaxID=1344416 RepID=A0A139AD90_GONPJ|nr:homoserine acetyltransferase [Gonapodya prolifera JEL478]|eukprot:KXS14629.1 homoserine acetyltransferase [Gonapodya prolifera JEL478]